MPNASPFIEVVEESGKVHLAASIVLFFITTAPSCRGDLGKNIDLSSSLLSFALIC